MERTTGLEFPCFYPVKVMVEHSADARRQVLDVVAEHVAFSRSSDVRYRASRQGRFESITITVRVESRQQLEALYQALHDLSAVKMML